MGGHTKRFAYFASANGNRSDLGLGTPIADVIHDAQAGGGGFASFIFNANPVQSAAPRDVDPPRHLPDSQRRPTIRRPASTITSARPTGSSIVSWVRTFERGLLLTVSPFYHYNAANYEGGPNDPIVTIVKRQSGYGGAQATLGGDVAKNNWQVGVVRVPSAGRSARRGDVQRRQQSELLPARAADRRTRSRLYAQDKLALTSWLTLSGGVRYTHFSSSGGVTEDVTTPRVGATVLIPQVNWIVRGFYGRFYQAPPLLTASGPLLDFVTAQNLGFIPLKGERDEEYQVGVAVPVHGWLADVSRFHTRATNYFDHNPVGESNVFFPVTIDGALIQGTEVTLRSPRSLDRRAGVSRVQPSDERRGRDRSAAGSRTFRQAAATSRSITISGIR